jgi:flagellar basal body-associated protein FliL
VRHKEPGRAPVDSQEFVCASSPSLSFPPVGTTIAFSSDMPDESVENSPPKKHGIGLALVFLILTAAVVWLWISRTSNSSSAPADGPVHSTLHLETFVLNLADSDQRAYLRVGVDLGLSRQLKPGEDPGSLAPVRDTILSVLSQSSSAELLTADGKTKLKEKLLQALQERVPQFGIEEVYFTEFLIQR